MPELHVFEYAVLRIVPQVEREEFINTGVVLYCARLKFLESRIILNEERLRVFSPELDMEVVKKNLAAFEQICVGNTGESPIAKLDRAARFRWLTATRSTVVQASKVHPGLCSNAVETLDRLFMQLVHC